MTTSVRLLTLAALVLPGPAARAQGTQTPKALPSFRTEHELTDYLQRVFEQRARQQQASASCSGALETDRYRTSRPGAVVLGKVTGTSGTALQGATVRMTPIAINAITSSDGRYLLRVPAESLAAARTVTLTVQSLGHSPWPHSLTVAQGDSIEVNVSLCEAVMSLAAVTVEAAAGITNTQVAGVDEGGIVKLHGDHLVILRRGRLFTVDIGGDHLRPVAAVDAFGPGIDPRATWYDELLVSGDRVVVVGYSYERGGTELGVFDIDAAGGLRHRATYQLRSNDYYSSRNYASRLVGSHLVFYTPLYLPYGLREPLSALPSMRRWQPSVYGDSGRFERIVTPQRVYHPAGWTAAGDVALHTVTVCDLAARELACEATVVIGPAARVFYVSAEAVYVWMSEWGRLGRRAPGQATLCRMPLDGSAPSALGVRGTPVDQFSFLESDDHYLNVLVRSDAGGDAMWRPEWSWGDASLLRVPLSAFGDGSQPAPWSMYRGLPTESGGAFHNRFVGDYLLYGNGSGWGWASSDASILYVVPWKGGRLRRLLLPHGTDRIEAMGEDAVVVGADEHDLHFTGIRLGGSPEPAQRYTLRNASQGELRSHGFFYRPDGARDGVLGLPVRGPGRPGYEHLFRESASILFLRNRERRFQPLGSLEAEPESERRMNDGCKASCVDWYGNARPIFIGDRIFALLGYELVEGRIELGQLVAARRVDFTPARVRAVSN